MTTTGRDVLWPASAPSAIRAEGCEFRAAEFLPGMKFLTLIIPPALSVELLNVWVVGANLVAE
jgi:hypothetical protein